LDVEFLIPAIDKTLSVVHLGQSIARWPSLLRSRVVCLLIGYKRSPLLLIKWLLHMELWQASNEVGSTSLGLIQSGLTKSAGDSAVDDLS